MPSIISASELRAVLGVSSSLYSDSYLNEIIDTSEGIILPMLVTFKSPIQEASLTDNVATILADNLGQYTFSCAITNADVASANIIPSGTATLSSASTYVGNQPVRSAVFVVSLEVFQSRLAGGGQIEGVDFTATPFRMGRSLFNRCVGLLGPYIDIESMAQ